MKTLTLAILLLLSFAANIAPQESFHGAAEDKNEFLNYIGNVINPLKIDESKANAAEVLTDEEVLAKMNGETISPKAEVQAVEQVDQNTAITATSVSQKVTQKIVSKASANSNVSGTHTAKLEKGTKTVKGMNSYQIVDANGNHLQILTSRNYNDLLGKVVTVEVEGTLESFVVKNITSGKILPKTGPETLLLLTMILSIAGAVVVRTRA